MACLLLVALLSAAVSVASAEDFPQAPVFQIPEVSNLIASSKLPTVFVTTPEHASATPSPLSLALSWLCSRLTIAVRSGMGDSCFNPGMKSITEAVGKRVGTYSVCIP